MRISVIRHRSVGGLALAAAGMDVFLQKHIISARSTSRDARGVGCLPAAVHRTALGTGTAGIGFSKYDVFLQKHILTVEIDGPGCQRGSCLYAGVRRTALGTGTAGIGLSPYDVFLQKHILIGKIDGPGCKGGCLHAAVRCTALGTETLGMGLSRYDVFLQKHILIGTIHGLGCACGSPAWGAARNSGRLCGAMMVRVRHYWRTIVIVLLAGACASALIAATAVQFVNSPPCDIQHAKDAAIRRLFREPNATAPIWPAFRVDGWGVSIAGVNPLGSDDRRSGKPSIEVRLLAGWPWRCLSAQVAFGTAGWGEASATLPLMPRMDTRGVVYSPELPLRPVWMALVGDIMFWAAAFWVLFAGPIALRRFIRVRHDLCGACGYPIGTSPVCTECGEKLPATSAAR